MNRDLILKYFEEYLEHRVQIKMLSLSLFEQEFQTDVTIKLMVGDEECDAVGTGVGIVDAGFNALINVFGETYRSLGTITLSDLYFHVDHSAGRGTSLKSKTTMKIEFRNDMRDRTFFSDNTTSMSYTAVTVLVKAFEFYINCELLFKRLKFLIQDAESRSRPSVSSKYKYDLSKVVEVTNYQSIA
jgi:hypothetical protein